MATFTGINLNGGSSVENLYDALISLNRSLTWQMGNLDSQNVREIGGWSVGMTDLRSRDFDVGMSTDDSQVENVRFWAGNASKESAPFRVYDSGRVVANNIQITGGNIIWGDVAAPPYSMISGGPPSDADRTYLALLADSNIKGFVNVGGTLFLNVDYVAAGTLSATNIDVTNLKAERISKQGAAGNLSVGYMQIDGDFGDLNLVHNTTSTFKVFNQVALGISLQHHDRAFMGVREIDVLTLETTPRGTWNFQNATVTNLTGVTAKFG